MSSCRIVSYAVTTLTSLLVLVSVGLLIVMHWQHIKIFSVQTDSMQPTFAAGDAIIVRPTSTDKLAPGDIVSYPSPLVNQMVISHRIVSLNQATGRIVTRGDAVTQSDPAIPASQVLGQAMAVAPGFGRLLDALHRPIGLVLALYLPASWLLWIEISRFSRVSRQMRYRLLR